MYLIFFWRVDANPASTFGASSEHLDVVLAYPHDVFGCRQTQLRTFRNRLDHVPNVGVRTVSIET